MPQFFLSPESISDKTFHLKGPEAFHITKVLRYREGQSLVLFDGKGGRYQAIIEKIYPDGSLSGALTATLRAKDERPRVQLNLYQGLLKSSHWEWLLEKGTELGISSFIPVLTPRTVVVLREADRAKAKHERWNKIIMASAKQCGATLVSELRQPMEFRDAAKACSGKGLNLLAWEGMSQTTAGETLRESLRAADQGRGAESLAVNLFIGPEGGFSEDEVDLAESLGIVVFGLGSRVLRAETAAISASTLILYEFGSL